MRWNSEDGSLGSLDVAVAVHNGTADRSVKRMDTNLYPLHKLCLQITLELPFESWPTSARQTRMKHAENASNQRARPIATSLPQGRNTQSTTLAQGWASVEWMG